MDKYFIFFLNFFVLLWFITVLVEASGIEKREVHRIVIKGGGGSRRPSRSHRGHHHHHYRDHGHKHHHHGSYESHERDRKPYYGNRHHNHHSGERDHSYEESPNKHYNSHEISYENSPRYNKQHSHRKPTEVYQSIEYSDEPKQDTYKESSGWSPLISSSENSPQRFSSFENSYHAKRNAHKDHGANKSKKRNPPPPSHLNIELTTSYPQKVPTYHSFLDTTDFPTLFSFDNDNLGAKPSASSTILGDFYPSAPGKNNKKKNNNYEVRENHKEDVFPKEQTSFNGLVPDLSETNSPFFAQSSKIQPVVVPAPALAKNVTIAASNNSNTNSKNVLKNVKNNGGSRSRRVKTRS